MSHNAFPRLTAVVAGSAMAIATLSGACAEKGEIPQGMPTTYKLSPAETAKLNETARLGRLGREVYEHAVGPTDDPIEEFVFSVLDFSNTGRNKTIALGKPVKLYSTVSVESITPSHDNNRAYVTYHEDFGNLAGDGEEEFVLANPDPDFFVDATASPEEMRQFYHDPATVVVKFSDSSSDALIGSCESTMGVNGNAVTASNKGECVHYDTLVSGPGLVDTLIDNAGFEGLGKFASQE